MKKFIPLFVLGAAFGIIEGSVVVYLRPLFNHAAGAGGMDFSMRIVPPFLLSGGGMVIIMTEIYREAATLVLLASAAWLAASSLLSWFCYFVFTFAVWDLVYYLWLAFRIGWPSSVFDWDILFLIPRMWFAPVIVPCVISMAGIIISMIVVRAIDAYGPFKVRVYHWGPIFFALALWQVSFLNKSVTGMTSFPESYSWVLFWAGLGACCIGAVLFYVDVFKKKKDFSLWSK